MDYIWIAVAFGCGFLVKQINLPPLVGYLAAGFGLNALGVKPDSSIDTLADFGVVLLLFTIGLKVNINSLFKPEVWAGASGHMAVIILLTTLNCLILGQLGLTHFTGISAQGAALIGFAVSFSSTVCAVKILEERGEMRALHGQVAIGILIIQDIAAVVFIALAADKTPSWWALSLLALPLIKPLLEKLVERSGHGEVLPLAGFFLAFTAGEVFELVGLKAHLGALVIGMVLSNHEKSSELAKALLNFKDIFLIGFFLSIGFTAVPTVDMLGVALIMAVALPFKAAMFFFWLTRLNLRSRSSFLAALGLANYSEFGLIVCSVSVAQGLLAKEWLVIMALSVTLSFIFSSVINTKAHDLHARWSDFIKRFDQPNDTQPEQYSFPADVSVLVIGMGRVGKGAYDTLQNHLDVSVCGIDLDKDRVADLCNDGRIVVTGDAEDPDFWQQINLDSVHLVMFAMPNHQDILEALKQVKLAGYSGKTAGIALYEDQRQQLLAAGIDEAFNFYAEAGAGFADQSMHLLQAQTAAH